MVAGALRHEFRYDTLNRLTTWEFETFNGVGGWAQNFATTFNYNKNGNLDSETTSGRSGRDVTYQYGQLGAPPACAHHAQRADVHVRCGRPPDRGAGPDRRLHRVQSPPADHMGQQPGDQLHL